MKPVSSNKPFVLAGFFAAIGASLCCITPVLALLAGVSGAASAFSWLDPLRPLFIGLTVVVLGFAWFQKLRPRTMPIDCACDENMPRPSFFQSGKFLAVITVLAILLLGFPSYSHLLLPLKASQPVVDQGLIYTVRLNIQGMTCEGCETTVNHVLSTKEGVIKAISSYKKGNAEVSYNPSVLKPEVLKNAIEEEIGYQVTHIEVIQPNP